MNIFRVFHVLILLIMSISINAADNTYPQQSEESSNPLLYHKDFIGREIKQNHQILSLIVPKRAEDAAFVPVKIDVGPSQEELFIEKIWLFIDKNPVPLAGVFDFGEASIHADLNFNIRVNEYSFVRAIARTEDGTLYQDSVFVKSSGGCSAPAGSDIAQSQKNLGKIRINTNKDVQSSQTLANLRINHFNLTGFQMDQLTRLRLLPHYIKDIKVTLDGKEVFSAQTSISISEDPNFLFYVPDNKKDQLKVEVVDTKGLVFKSKSDS